MNKTEFEERWPLVMKAINMVSFDNEMIVLGEFDIEDIDEDFDAHNAKLEEMSAEEFEEFCIGEHQVVQKIKEKYQAQSVDIFLERVFDGQYNQLFFQD